MSAVLDRATETGLEAQSPAPRPIYRPRTCPECLGAFQPCQSNQVFCCSAHKRAYNNRWLKRGAVLAPMQAAARATRNGTRGNKGVGKKASNDANTLLSRWHEEDLAAGRMSAVDYMALRYRLGLAEI